MKPSREKKIYCTAVCDWPCRFRPAVEQPKNLTYLDLQYTSLCQKKKEEVHGSHSGT